MPEIEVNLAGIRLKNPTILASGIMGCDKASLRMAAGGGAGAVTTKSLTKEPRSGHGNPTMVEVEGGFLNAIGYSNMGLSNARAEFSGMSDVGAPAICSVVAETAQGFAEMAAGISDLGFSAVEVVLSCPHTPGYGLLAGHGTPEATLEISKRVKAATSLPLIVKLSPNTAALGDVAKAAVEGKADAINMGNTLGPGMVIDTGFGRPVLAYKVGGMSGPAVKPITVRCVFDVWEATEGKVPIIGTGGVVTGLDAVEMMMAGATAVGVGTGVYYRGLDVFKKIIRELGEYMAKNKVSRLEEIVGVAHG
jgi:dihydroorotate dehydrogenase (NAD+) catalytic subunit